MKIGEIAKATGLEPNQVAEDLGVQSGKGVHLRSVDDDKASAYMAEHVRETVDTAAEEQSESNSGRVRFWSRSRSYTIPADPADQRGDILFEKWVYECDSDALEAQFMRKRRDYFIAQHTYEVIDKPHSDPMMIAEFMRAMMSVVLTGPPGDPTVSREGRDCIKALLPAHVAARLSTTEKNAVRSLVRAVAENVSLNVDTYEGEL